MARLSFQQKFLRRLTGSHPVNLGEDVLGLEENEGRSEPARVSADELLARDAGGMALQEAVNQEHGIQSALEGWSNQPRPKAVALRSPAKGGKTRIGRPRGGLLVPGKPRWGCDTEGKPRGGLGSGPRLRNQLTLLPVPALRVPNGLPHRRLITPYGTDPVSPGPKMQSRHPPLRQ